MWQRYHRDLERAGTRVRAVPSQLLDAAHAARTAIGG